MATMRRWAAPGSVGGGLIDSMATIEQTPAMAVVAFGARWRSSSGSSYSASAWRAPRWYPPRRDG